MERYIKFLGVKSFIIMAVMMTGGIFHLVSPVFITVFYTDLGASLLLAGILLGKNFFVRLKKFD